MKIMQLSNIYQQHSPSIISWIQNTLLYYSKKKIALSHLDHPRLQGYFPTSVLENAFVVYVEEVPVIPLDSIPELSFMNQLSAAGITYLDTFFIIEGERTNTAIHFHELIHVLQWEYLGMENFLLYYAHGLLHFGYRESPLERMAYDLEARFSAGEIFNAVEEVKEMIKPLQDLVEALRTKS
jgi:hypothetical protein